MMPRSLMPCSWRAVLPILISALLLSPSLPALAQVSDGDWGFTVGPELTLQRFPEAGDIGPGARLGVARGIHPLWNVGVNGSVSRILGEQPRTVGSTYAGFTTMLDVVSVVPWAGLGLGAVFEPATPVGPVKPWLSAQARAGLDYRPRRAWSVGFEVDARFGFVPDLATLRQVGFALRFTYMKSRNAI